MKKALSVLLFLALCLGVLTACGGGGDSSPALSGKYVCTSFEIGGEVLTPEQLSTAGIDPETVYLEFHDAKNCTLLMMDEKSEGTYALKGNVLSVTFDGTTETLKYENDIVSIIDPEMGTTMVLEKK